MNAVLAIEHLCVEIDGKMILEDISFSLQPGEMVALLGASGSGKSTLLAAICGHRRLTSGSILPRPGAGFVPQIPFEARSPLSVEEIVAMGRPRRGLVTRHDERARSWEILGRLGLTGLGSRRLSELSGGERQRVAIATALAFDTPLLLLDEPTSGADPVLADEVLSLLKDLTCAGNTVLLAGHDASRLVGCSDRVLGLSGGHLILDAPASGIVPGTLERVYDRPTA